MRRPPLVVAALVLAGSMLLVACSSSTSGSGSPKVEESPAEVRGYRPTPTLQVGKFSLTDHATDPAGAPFAFRAAPGGLLVVYFGYLSCPDICPVSMADLAAGLEDLGPALADRVEVGFVTVDIERDTGARINDYLTHFFPGSSIHSLRANDSFELRGVTDGFGAQWQIDPHEPGATTYGVAHTGLTFVVDDKGQLVWEWPFATTGPDIAATLGQLFSAESPQS